MPLNKPTGEMLNAGSSSAPSALGTASAGVGPNYSFGDHRHAMPSAGEVGAIPTTALSGLATTAQVNAITPVSIGALATSAAGSWISTSALPSLATTQQLNSITPASIGAMATSERGSYATTAALAAITPASIGALATSAASGFATLTSGRLTTSQIPALGGDISLSAGSVSATVQALQNQPVAGITPTNGQVLQWNGSAWVPGTNPTGGSGGGGLVFYANQGTAPDNPLTGLPGTPKELGRVADVAQSTVASGTLSQSSYDLVANFVSDVLDPDVASIPAGLWDFNVWASSNSNSANQTILQVLIYKYNGTTSTLIAASDDVYLYDNSIQAQYVVSVTVPQTTIALTDRVYIEFRAKATTNGRTVTLKFGDSTPTHLHSTIPSIGGSGSVFVVNGVFQSPARTIVDSDISATAGIALSKLAGAASTAQVAAITAQGLGALTTAQIGSWISTSQQGSLATTAQVAAITAQSLGAVTTTQITAYATTAQVSAITPASIGALATSAASGFATTAQVQAATTAQLGTIKVGANLTITPDGTLSGQAGAAYTSASPLGLTAGGTGAITLEAARAVLGAPQAVTVYSSAALTVATAGTLTGATWTSGSAVITFTSSSVTPVVGMSVSASGFSAGVILSVDSATQVTMNVAAATTQATGVSVALYNSTTSTLVTTTGTTLDGRAIQTGDIVVLANQPALATRGPWLVIAVGTGLTLSRPAWFPSGMTLSGGMLLGATQGSSFGSGFFVVMPYNTNSSAVVGTGSLATFVVSQRASNAITGSNTFTGRQNFQAGAAGSGAVPFAFQAGVLMTTPQAHSVEWDGSQLYVTNSPAAERLPVATSKAQINAQTGTAYTLALTDAGYLVTLSNAAAIAVTIPLNSSVAFPIGTQVLLTQLGAGQVTVAGASGVTVQNKNGLKTSGQYAVISLIKIATDTWLLGGDATV